MHQEKNELRRRDFMKRATQVAAAATVSTGIASGISSGAVPKEKKIDSAKTIPGNVKYTMDDHALLAQFCVKALDSDPIKAMRVD